MSVLFVGIMVQFVTSASNSSFVDFASSSVAVYFFDAAANTCLVGSRVVGGKFVSC